MFNRVPKRKKHHRNRRINLARIGFLSLYAPGHLNPSMAFGKALEERGHTVTFFNVLDTENTIKEQGLRFVSFGHSVYPVGLSSRHSKRSASSRGLRPFNTFWSE